MTDADDRNRGLLQRLPGRPADNRGAEPGPSSRYAARLVDLGIGVLQRELDAIPPAWHLVAAFTAHEGATMVLLLEREAEPRWSFTCSGCGAREFDVRRRSESTMCSTPGCNHAMLQEQISPAPSVTAAETPGENWVRLLQGPAGERMVEISRLRAEVERWKAAQREAAEASGDCQEELTAARADLAAMTKERDTLVRALEREWRKQP